MHLRFAPFAFALLLFVYPAFAAAAEVVLKNGMTVEGALGKISAVAENPLQGDSGGDVAVRLIVISDDQMRRVFFSTYQVQEVRESAIKSMERIRIPQRTAIGGNRIGSLGPILNIEPFDEWGRRTFTMSTNDGRMDVIQGITEITPTWTRVEGLMSAKPIIWDMRIATSSIPRETLSKILLRQLDPNDADQRLRIVRLYLQAERYGDAQEELAAAIHDFPELADLQREVTALRQLAAQRMIREIKLRRAAGQHRLAYNMLSGFPTDGVAGETLLEVRENLEQYNLAATRGKRILELLQLHLSKIEDANMRQKLAPICAEIAAELNVNNIDRLADYLRLADDEQLSPDQRLALAVSGWLLGSGEATENAAVAASLAEVRNLARDYLLAARPHERDAILAKLASCEGATPNYMSRIIANMKPPMATKVNGYPDLARQNAPAPAENNGTGDPAGAAPADEAAGREPPAEGEAAAEQAEAAFDPNVPVGMATLQIPGLQGEADITYHVQLPPEYDPYRRYPAIVTLNGSGSTPLHQIDWWAGMYQPQSHMRMGQASRRGFIVIAPQWTNRHQLAYEYSAREHAAVLFSLRDAMRRFSIDTDRVYLSGHSMGAEAAWDIGLAHPDVWAGVIPIVPPGRDYKYISRCWENAMHCPLYFVAGELDGDSVSSMSSELNRYFKRIGYDVMLTEYKGRGHEHFQDEIQRIFDWIELHRRDFHPREFKAFTMRPWANHFWYLQIGDLPTRSTVVPSAWPPPANTRPIETKASVSERNRVSVSTGAGKVTLWLSPKLVDFDKKIEFSINGSAKRPEYAPNIQTILEDVRTRGDRLNPFWCKVELDTGRGRR